jgi:hypothetical protein
MDEQADALARPSPLRRLGEQATKRARSSSPPERDPSDFRVAATGPLPEAIVIEAMIPPSSASRRWDRLSDLDLSSPAAPPARLSGAIGPGRVSSHAATRGAVDVGSMPRGLDPQACRAQRPFPPVPFRELDPRARKHPTPVRPPQSHVLAGHHRRAPRTRPVRQRGSRRTPSRSAGGGSSGDPPGEPEPERGRAELIGAAP